MKAKSLKWTIRRAWYGQMDRRVIPQNYCLEPTAVFISNVEQKQRIS
jgi:hypothetical protein